MQRDGEVVYRTVCQSCHMAAMQGAVGAGAYPALANDPKLAAAGYSVNLLSTAPGAFSFNPKPAKPEPNRDFERTPPSAVRAIFG